MSDGVEKSHQWAHEGVGGEKGEVEEANGGRYCPVGYPELTLSHILHYFLISFFIVFSF